MKKKYVTLILSSQKGGVFMQIKESAENYLECILMLRAKNGSVRSIDVAHHMAFTKASVSVAMKNFRQEGYITVDADGEIFLTEKGTEIAQRIYERHQVITEALMALGVSPETASQDSCKIEHDISEETFACIKKFLEK
ncbi:MAG: metal-dependent transcriptional regulator [Bacteroidales bacterium]|nr:metal-dependent transcriptional regulator [Bacteroidales bacterium]